MPISNKPPKGTADWLPEEFAIRKYIFDTWRKVCQSYGYLEYLTPLVESAEVYRAKSGEDVGGKELVTFMDLGGRELSIRPEMTPSVTRLVSQIYDAAPKPIRFFSIANFMRNEKPQRGRNREFWQLNVDIFGSESLMAEVEACLIALDIMLAFAPPENSFSLCLNDRRLIDALLVEAGVMPAAKTAVVKILDKWQKLSLEEFHAALSALGVPSSGADILVGFMETESLEALVKNFPNLADNPGVKTIGQLMFYLTQLGYAQWLTFKSSIIRGFDYYDGLVFEIFDNHPDNKRALFGGGRYNGLAAIFGGKSFPAVGFAPGDETIKLFLESWGLLDLVRQRIANSRYFLPLLSDKLTTETLSLAKSLRAKGLDLEVSFEVMKLGKALEYANKKELTHVVLFGDFEKDNGIYKIKDMLTGIEIENRF